MITVWGACDGNDSSWLYDQYPSRGPNKTGWFTFNSININPDNLFPKDKPQQFKLIPIDGDKK